MCIRDSSKTLIPLYIRFPASIRAKLADILIALLIGKCIPHLLAAADLKQRRLCDTNMTMFDQRTHKTEKESEQQCSDMAAVDIGIGHNDNPVSYTHLVKTVHISGSIMSNWVGATVKLNSVTVFTRG